MHTFICKLWSIWEKNKTVQGEINLHCPKKTKVSLNQLKKQHISMLLNSLMIEVINFFLSKTANLNIIIRKRRRNMEHLYVIKKGRAPTFCSAVEVRCCSRAVMLDRLCSNAATTWAYRKRRKIRRH